MKRVNNIALLSCSTFCLLSGIVLATDVGPYIATHRMDSMVWEFGAEQFERTITHVQTEISVTYDDKDVGEKIGSDSSFDDTLKHQAIFARVRTQIHDVMIGHLGVEYNMPSSGLLEGGGDYVSVSGGLSGEIFSYGGLSVGMFCGGSWAFNAESGAKGKGVGGSVSRNVFVENRFTEENIDYWSGHGGIMIQQEIHLDEVDDGAILIPYFGIQYSMLSLIDEVETEEVITTASRTEAGVAQFEEIIYPGSIKMEYEEESPIGAVAGCALKFADDWYARLELRAISETSASLSIARDL